MSYWDQEEMKTESKGGYYIKMADGESRTLTFHGHSKRPQKENTPADFKTADGMEFEWKFTEKNAEGVEEDRAFTSSKVNNAFIIGMKQAGIEPGDAFTITRKGVGTDTRYECAKLNGDATNPLMAGTPAPF